MHESWRDVPISEGKDGRWHALADVGHKPNGRIDRRHRSGRTKEDVEQRLRELFKKLNSGRDTGPGRAPTVRQWWTEWLTDIAPYGEDALAPTTLQNYWSKCRRWIFPNLGELRLPELESPTPIRGLYKQMRKENASDSLLLQVHAVIRRGLAVAVSEEKISRNGAALMSRPGTPQHRRDPLPNEAVGRILTVVSGLRLASRWEVGLGTGCRQGEALGLDWNRVDLDDGVADMSWQLTRVSWRHGCDNPYQCADRAGVGGRSLHRKKPCARANRGPHKGQCAVHTSGRGCPQLCGRDCDRHASRCPQRVGGGLVLRPRKGWDPRNPVPHIVSLPPVAVQSLREWRTAQDAERQAAGNVWRQDVVRYPDGKPADLVWRQPDGGPLDPRADWEEWSDILVRAEVPHVPLHTGRHTAATMFLDLGIELAVVQEELGHKHIATTRIYGHVRQTVTGRAAARLGEHMDKLRRGAQPEEAAGLASVTSLDTARRKRRAAQ